MKFLPSKPLIESNFLDTEIKYIEEAEHGFEVVLEQSIFQPESVFYPGDKGTISDIEIERVYLKENKIFNVLKEKPEDNKVHLMLDIKRRFDLLQQQTGLMLFRIALQRLFKKDILSYKIGEYESEIIIDKLTESQRETAEIFTNRLITSAQDIEVLWELDPEINKNYVFSDEGTAFISIYEMPFHGFQCHNTGEVGSFIITEKKEMPDGDKFNFLCGERAWKYCNSLINGKIARRE